MMNGICLGHINRCILRVYLNTAIQCHACSIIESCNLKWNILLGYVGIRGGFNKRSTAMLANSHQLKIIPSSVRVGCLPGIVCRNCCKNVKKLLRPKLLHENPTDLDTFTAVFSSCKYLGICPQADVWSESELVVEFHLPNRRSQTMET